MPAAVTAWTTRTRADGGAASAEEAAVLSAAYPAGEALNRWIDRFIGFIATKRGLAAALHSGDTAYSGLPTHRNQRLVPALRGLLDAAATAGEIRHGVDAADVVHR